MPETDGQEELRLRAIELEEGKRKDKAAFYWSVLQHEDTLFSNRNAAFLLVESIFMTAAVVGVLRLEARSWYEPMFGAFLCVMGAIITAWLWLSVNGKHERIIRDVKKKLAKVCPEWQGLLKDREPIDPPIHKQIGVHLPWVFLASWGAVFLMFVARFFIQFSI